MTALILNLSPTIELTDEQFFQLCVNNSGEDVLLGFRLELNQILN